MKRFKSWWIACFVLAPVIFGVGLASFTPAYGWPVGTPCEQCNCKNVQFWWTGGPDGNQAINPTTGKGFNHGVKPIQGEAPCNGTPGAAGGGMTIKYWSNCNPQCDLVIGGTTNYQAFCKMPTGKQVTGLTQWVCP